MGRYKYLGEKLESVKDRRSLNKLLLLRDLDLVLDALHRDPFQPL